MLTFRRDCFKGLLPYANYVLWFGSEEKLASPPPSVKTMMNKDGCTKPLKRIRLGKVNLFEGAKTKWVAACWSETGYDSGRRADVESCLNQFFRLKVSKVIIVIERWSIRTIFHISSLFKKHAITSSKEVKYVFVWLPEERIDLKSEWTLECDIEAFKKGELIGERNKKFDRTLKWCSLEDGIEYFKREEIDDEYLVKKNAEMRGKKKQKDGKEDVVLEADEKLVGWELERRFPEEWFELVAMNRMLLRTLGNITQTLNDAERKGSVIFPPKEDVWKAFELCPPEKVKVVIFGQDPYHGAGQAHGLSFSVKEGVKVPPSLRNIYSCLKVQFGYEIPSHGCLEYWAKQGVLMLNTAFTVLEGKANSHRKIWSEFSNAIIKVISSLDQRVVFMLWGGNAHKLEGMLTNRKHKVLKFKHPSPLAASRGPSWDTCPHFKEANEFLTKYKKDPIDWDINNWKVEKEAEAEEEKEEKEDKMRGEGEGWEDL